MENFTKADLEQLLRSGTNADHLMITLQKALKSGKKVILPGIGKLAVRERQARTGKALGGKTYTSPAHNTVVLEVSPKFKTWLNQ